MGRLVAAVLIASMLPTLFVPGSRAAGSSQYGTYETWLRAQLRVPATAAVDAAIERAVESDSESFNEFIAAFLDAYAEGEPDQPLSQVFTDRDLSNAALISFLQRRYSQIADEGVLPRVYLSTLVQSLVATGSGGLAAATRSAALAASVGLEVVGSTFVQSEIVIPFRTLSSARSLGP